MTIEPGKTYWVEFANERLKLLVVRESIVPGWWWCKSEEHDAAAMFPAEAFKEEILPPTQS